MKISTLKDVFAEKLHDLYSTETQLLKALPKLEKAATDPELKKGFHHHLQQTELHAIRLKSIAEKLDLSLNGKVCDAIVGLIKSGQKAIDSDSVPAMKDVMLIGAARSVEHFEVASYTGACDLARALQLPDALKLLSITLSEEVATDDLLAKACLNGLAKANASEE